MSPSITPPAEAMVLLDVALAILGIDTYTFRGGEHVFPTPIPLMYQSVMRTTLDVSDGIWSQTTGIDTWTIRIPNGDLRASSWLEWHDDHWVGFRFVVRGGPGLWEPYYLGPVVEAM